MGKQTKSKRLRAQGRLDPLSATGRVQAQPPVAESASAEAQAEEKVVQIMQDMGGMQPEKRASGAHSVAAVAASGFTGLRVMLRRGLVGKLSLLLCDSNSEVRSAAVLALRNVGLRGGDEVYEGMVAADVMTPALTALSHSPLVAPLLAAPQMPKVGWIAGAAAEEEAHVCQVLDLVWEMCESSEIALERFNARGAHLLPALVSLLSPASFSTHPSLAGSAAQALHVLSEDNPPAAALFAANPPMLNAVQDVATGTTGAPPLLAALALGTLSNLGVQPRGGFGAILSSVEAALGPELMARAPEVLSNVEKGGDAAQRQVDVSVMEEAEEEKGGGSSGKKAPSTKPIGHHKFEEQFMHTEGAAAAPHVAHSEWTQEVIVSQVVLQMLANMMVSDEAEEEDAGGDDEGWMTDEEGEGDMEDEGPAGGEAAAAAAWLADSKVVWRIAALSTFPPQELLDSLAQSPARDAPDMAHKLAERQASALDCLANWVAAIAPPPDSDPTTHAGLLEPLLAAVRDQVLGPASAAAVGVPSILAPVFEAAQLSLSNLVLVFLRRATALGLPGLLALPAPAQAALAEWARSGTSEVVRVHAIRALATLGTVLRDASSNAAIGSLLLDSTAAPSAPVAAEAVIALMDVYAEDDLNDSVMRPLDMLTRLDHVNKGVAGAVAAWVTSEKQRLKAIGKGAKDPDYVLAKARLQEAKTNLPRFIAYKRDLGL